MTSTPRRLALTRLAVPLFAALTACGNPPADTDGDADGSSTGDTGTDDTVDVPTGDDDDGGEPTPAVASYLLRVDDTPPPPVVLELDKEKSLEVFGEAAARDIKLIEVDSGPLLDEVLQRIQSSCGTGWRVFTKGIKDSQLPENPQHNCATTELGKTYGAWQTSPQYALVRLLTMTPRNANVAGTSLGPLWSYFHTPQKHNNAFGLSFEDILAASLSCPTGGEAACVTKLNSFDQADDPKLIDFEKDLHTRPFIELGILKETLKVTLMESHPNIANPDGMLAVSLYDALKDMQPLSEKYGPHEASGHPGLLMPDDENFTTRSDALTADFKMVATADSNLRRVEGIDASIGAGEMFVNVDAAGTPLAFDFMDEKKVKFEGLTDVPTVDMRMRMMELPGDAVPACDGTLGDTVADCQGNLPGSPLGTNYIWSKPLWSLERIVAQAAYETFKDRKFQHCFIDGNPCDARVSIGADTPGGWSVFDVKVGVTTPGPQYFWELLLGVAQTAMHDFTGPDLNDVNKNGNTTEILPAANGQLDIEEGQANPIFALKALPIGLTATQMLAQIRPNLQSQAAKIAGVILGNYWKKNARLDFYYRRADGFTPEGGAPILFFVDETDLRPSKDDPAAPSAYGYKYRGFYADRALEQKLSRTDLDGSSDTTHEKLQLATGETTVYMQDDEAVTYELIFNVPDAPDPTGIFVRVRALNDSPL